MGVVFAARQLETGAQRAIKATAPLSDLEDLERLRREGEALARLSHPNLLRIHGSGIEEGRAYLILELAEGGSLEDRLRQGPLPLAEACELFARLGDALHSAHEAGILHRDLKPDNVLLSETGEPKIADFGLALLDGRTRLTQTGTVLGTPIYMAPEQARAEPPAPAADVYALAASFYRAVVGSPPIESAGSVLATLARIQDQVPPSLGDRLTEVSPRIAAMVDRSLSKRPEERPRADEFARELRGEAEPGAPASSRARWLTPLVALTSAAMLGLALGPLSPSPQPPATSSLPRVSPADSLPSARPLSPTPSPAPPTAFHTGELAFECLQSVAPSFPRLAQAIADHREVPEVSSYALTQIALESTPASLSSAAVTLVRRGYLEWAHLPAGSPQDLVGISHYRRLASLGQLQAASRLAKFAPSGPESRAWSPIRRYLRAAYRTAPGLDPALARHWALVWGCDMRPDLPAWVEGRREASEGDPTSALERYRAAWKERGSLSAADRVRLGVELQRIAEVAWLTTWPRQRDESGRAALLQDMAETLTEHRWGMGLILQARLRWPAGESGARFRGDRNAWLALGADLAEGCTRAHRMGFGLRLLGRWHHIEGNFAEARGAFMDCLAYDQKERFVDWRALSSVCLDAASVRASREHLALAEDAIRQTRDRVDPLDKEDRDHYRALVDRFESIQRLKKGRRNRKQRKGR